MRNNEPFNIEEVPDFDTQLLISGIQAKRFTHKGRRFYYWTEEREDGLFISPLHLSGTTVAGEGMRVEEHLIKWWADKENYEAVVRYVAERANFGTFTHICIAQTLQKIYQWGRPDVELAVEDVMYAFELYAEAMGYGKGWAWRHANELFKDLAAFITFCKQYDVKPLLIEKTLFMPGVATTLDMVLDVLDGDRYKSGPRKGVLKKPDEAWRENVVVDYKSGKNHSIVPKEAVQLELQRRVMAHNFPETPIANTYILKSSNWKTSPSYWLGKTTGHPEVHNVDNYLDVAWRRCRGIETKPYKTTISGYLGGDGTVPSFEALTVEEVIQAREHGRFEGMQNGFMKNARLEAETMAARALADSFIHPKNS